MRLISFFELNSPFVKVTDDSIENIAGFCYNADSYIRIFYEIQAYCFWLSNE